MTEKTLDMLGDVVWGIIAGAMAAIASALVFNGFALGNYGMVMLAAAPIAVSTLVLLLNERYAFHISIVTLIILLIFQPWEMTMDNDKGKSPTQMTVDETQTIAEKLDKERAKRAEEKVRRQMEIDDLEKEHAIGWVLRNNDDMTTEVEDHTQKILEKGIAKGYLKISKGKLSVPLKHKNWFENLYRGIPLKEFIENYDQTK